MEKGNIINNEDVKQRMVVCASVVIIAVFFLFLTACGQAGTSYLSISDADAPVVRDQTFVIAENSSNGSLVGTVIAVDNIGISSYNIIAGNVNEKDDSVFTIDNNGRLSVATTNLNYEISSNYRLAVRVNDTSINASYAVITINVSNVDDAPPIITNHTFSIVENVPTNTLVGVVNATDESGITNFAITSGNSDGAFAIDISGRLTTIREIDYDTTPSYSLNVKVVDGKGYAASNTISITVVPDTTLPTITNHVFTVAEDATNGTKVGIVQASDSSGITNFAIIAGNSNGSFVIKSNGLLATTTNLDYGTVSNYSLTVEVSDGEGNTSNGIVSINVIDILEWQTMYITNSLTNEGTVTSALTALNQTTPIDGLKSKIFVWLDISVSPLLMSNSGGRLTNWLDKKSYVIAGTNATPSPTLSVTTNTNSPIQIINNERVAFTNIVTTTNVTSSLILTNAISGMPQSDISGNDSLSFQTGNNGYVDVDYEGSDRVGFAIDTTPMGSSDNITAFYLVTEWIQGNNNSHIPLGYDDLGDDNRFFTKRSANDQYIATNGKNAKGNIVLGDSTLERNADFAIPSGVHLLSRRGLSISKSDLNGILGSFPISSGNGGNQRFRELIVLTNTLTAADHSNIVKYLYDKWNIPLQGANITSYYSASGGNPLGDALDGDISTYFQGHSSAQNAFTSNRVLFEYRIYASVLDGGISLLSSVIGLSSSTNSLYLRTGYNLNNDALKAPFRVEVFRTNDNSWFVLSNVPTDNTSDDKEFIFALGHASNDFLGYRLVANGNVSSGNWFTIDEFLPSSLSHTSPSVTAFSNMMASKVHQTNEDVFLTGFTNYLHFDQAVYGLTTNDFVIENASIISFSAVNASNYLLTVRPSPFYGGSNTNTNTVIQSPQLRISLPDGAATNASGSDSSSVLLILDFVPQNPFNGLDVGGNSAPVFVDLDGDGDLDLISGELSGIFNFYSNDGSNNFILQTNANNPLDGFNTGTLSTPSFVDLDGDGDLDLVAGEQDGFFNFYRNDGGNFTEQTNDSNPLDEFDVGNYSTPSFVDLDGDGNTDLVSGADDGTFNFYMNDSDKFTEQTNDSNPLDGFDVGNYSAPSFVDLDGDGDLDLISGELSGLFNFYRNDGTKFTEQTGVNNPLDGFDLGIFSRPSFIDLDGDGDSDLVSGANNGNFYFYMNIGGQFAEAE